MALETQTQIPVTTAPFAGGSIPGLGGGQVPGIPSPGGAPPPQTGDPNDKAKQILAAILQAASRKQVANTAVPSPIPAGGDVESARNIGMNTGNPHAWGTQRFLATLGASIKNGIRAQKEAQLANAEGKWTYLQAALNELYNAQQSGDPRAVAVAQKKVDSITMDKDLKKMAKALNQDWLNPEKTDVWKQALDNVTKKQLAADQTNAQKEQAASGLKRMFQHLIQKAQGGPKPQLTDEQRQAMGREIQEKAPTTQGVTDPKVAAEMMRAEAELIRAQKSAPEKYEFKTVKDADGSEKIVALDKTDPTKPSIEVKSQSGEKVKPGDKHFASEGKLEVVGGVPTGRVMHGGRYVAPGQEGYTADDKKAVDMGMNAQGLSEKQKEKLASIRGSSYATSRAANTPIAVTDNETGESTYATMLDVARNPSKYVQPGESEKIGARDAVHRSLKVNFSALGKDLENLPNGLDTETQAIIAAALKTDDSGILGTLLVNKIKQGAPDEVLHLITDIKAMQEDILVLRTVGGMGQGSDMMRSAMIRIIPGAGSSSVKEAKMQMEAAQRTSESLFKGRPEAKFAKDGETGGMETKTYNGAVYQRKRGSSDDWALVPKPK
jgi:hypothetical protein